MCSPWPRDNGAGTRRRCAAGCEPLAQFGEPLPRRGPEAEGVDREDDVEGLQSDAGFTLAEQRALLAPRDGAPDWRELAQRKLAELDERIARAQAARDAISHGLRCPRRDATQRPDFQAVCPDFQARIIARRPDSPRPHSHQR
jgi:hypothetical protein